MVDCRNLRWGLALIVAILKWAVILPPLPQATSTPTHHINKAIKPDSFCQFKATAVANISSSSQFHSNLVSSPWLTTFRELNRQMEIIISSPPSHHPLSLDSLAQWMSILQACQFWDPRLWAPSYSASPMMKTTKASTLLRNNTTIRLMKKRMKGKILSKASTAS